MISETICEHEHFMVTETKVTETEINFRKVRNVEKVKVISIKITESCFDCGNKGEQYEEKRSITKREIILNLLKNYPYGLLRSEIASRTGYKNTHHASGILGNMVRDGQLIKNGPYYKIEMEDLIK